MTPTVEAIFDAAALPQGHGAGPTALCVALTQAQYEELRASATLVDDPGGIAQFAGVRIEVSE